MKAFIKQHPVWSFLIINYIISWAFLFPCYQIIIENDGLTPLALIGFVGAYGPTIAAIIIQYIIDKSQLKILLKSLIKVKTSFFLFLFVIFVPVLIYIIAYLVSAGIFNGPTTIHWIEGIKSYPIFFLFALPFGPMGEELGWRGFMLPKLLQHHSTIKSTVLVGLAWGIWHMASFTFPGAAIPSFLSVSIWTIGLYFINTISLSMVFTYVHLKSRGSVFLAILLHAFFNAASNITFSFFIENEDYNNLLGSYIINIVLAGLIGLLLIRRVKI